MKSRHPASPETIGPYKVVDTLGTGGMSAVYRAVQPSLDREVAIKVLPRDCSKNPEAIARFERESTLVAQLTHPGIIQIFDRGVDDDRYYIVMEYVRGCSLEDLIRERRLAVHEIVDIASQVANGLAHAHDKGIVHRDIKPGNILVSSDSGAVKIVDFGIAQIAESRLQGDTLTRDNIGMGTLNYMAPEQRLNARAVDGRADIFAFGVVLYEMLTGRLPMGHFKRPEETRDDTPPLLSSIVIRCLEQNPADRYQTLPAVIADLDRVTVLHARYRDALAAMAATVRRVSGKATTGIVEHLRGLAGVRLASPGWRRAALALVVIAGLALGIRAMRGARDSRPGGSVSAGTPGDTGAQRRPESYAERFATAAELLASGNPDEALTVLRAIRTEASQGDDVRSAGAAQWRIAEIHHQTGQAHLAAQAYSYFVQRFGGEPAFADSPNIPAALYWTGHFRETEKKHDYEEALAHYRRLYTTYPDHELAPEAIFHAARLMDEKVRVPKGTQAKDYYSLVAQLYRRVIDESPRSPVREDAFKRLGDLYCRKRSIRDYGRGAAVYEELAGAYPSSGHDPLYLAADVYDRKLRNTSRAIQLYEAFLAARPGSDNAERARSRLRRLR